MKKASASKPNRKQTSIDWSRAVPNPHAAYLRDRRWHVRLDPDLVDLLTVSGDPSERLLGVANLPKRRERLVVTIPMTEREFKSIRPLLDRIGATVEYVPPHPNWRLTDQLRSSPRRRAG